MSKSSTKKISQSINQLVNQSINQSITQPINQSINHSTNDECVFSCPTILVSFYSNKLVSPVSLIYPLLYYNLTLSIVNL